VRSVATTFGYVADLARRRPVGLALLVVALAGLWATSYYSYLLFHTFAELFYAVVAYGILIMAWNLRTFLDDDYPLFLGVSLFFVATLHVLHAVAYGGMGVFPGDTRNLSTQLWIALSAMAAVSLFIAPRFIGRRMRLALVAAVYLAVTSVAVAAIVWWKVFPVCYVAGQGLTPFKKVSEYVISGILIVAIGVLLRRGRNLRPSTRRLLVAALVVSVASELSFTEYVGVYSAFNLIGHLLMVVSAWLMYTAVVETGLAEPHALAVANLELSEQAALAAQARAEETAHLYAGLEAGLLPRAPLEHSTVRALTRYRPGERRLRLGGDFFDIVDLDRGRVAVVVGDVSGHGPEAAALGAMLRTSWRALNVSGVAPATVVATLDKMVADEAQSRDQFATLVAVWIDSQTRRLDLVNVGHPQPLVLNGGLALVEAPAHPPLGLSLPEVRQPTTIDLPAKWGLLLYTDGLIEGMAAPGTSERFGQERLIRAVSRTLLPAPTEEGLDALLAEVEAANGGPLPDDVAVVLLHECTRTADDQALATSAGAVTEGT